MIFIFLHLNEFKYICMVKLLKECKMKYNKFPVIIKINGFIKAKHIDGKIIEEVIISVVLLGNN